ncbi:MULTISPECIES: ribosomal protein L7/L12 [unclassified Nocardiopsis]|uniref:ribosomal protein L7/L12 n=1 Tax=Nocardiopsis TaxID=2013 RepID=UPI00387A850E
MGFFDGLRKPPAPVRPLDQGTAEEALALVRARRKIEAIKLVRERTGMGLADAKNTVDALEEGRSVPVEPTPGHSLADRVRELLAQDRVAEAIVLVSRETGMTETESARFIDSLGR